MFVQTTGIGGNGRQDAVFCDSPSELSHHPGRKPGVKLACIALASCLVFLQGCVTTPKSLDPPSVSYENTPHGNFDAFWTDIDQTYPLFNAKGVDWEQKRALYLPDVREDMPEEELWQVLVALMRSLRDPHTSLLAPRFGRALGVLTPPDITFKQQRIRRDYLREQGSLDAARRNIWGILPNGAIYLHLGDLGGTVAANSWLDNLDAVLARHVNAPGVVIDVRNCPGGNHRVARHVAEAFAHRRRHYISVVDKLGPAHEQFGAPQKWFLQPRKLFSSDRPIIVLTNRATISAAEVLVVALRLLPNTTHIGAPTAGAFGSTATRELPNGWSYVVPTNRFLAADGTLLSGPIVPHRRIEHTINDSDLVLDAAMQLIPSPVS